MTQVRGLAPLLMAIALGPGATGLLVARPARAQTPDGAGSEWVARPFALEAQLGLGAPLGLAGVAADYSVLPWLSAVAGAGWSTGGLQVSAGARARLLPIARSRLTLQLDYSLGGAMVSSTPVVGGGGAEIQAERAHWLHAALGVERRAANGVTARIYAGYSFLLGMDDWRCEDTSQGAANTACSERPEDLLIGPGVFSFGFSAGYAF